MGWKIIDIDSPCLLKSCYNNLIIFNTKRLTIPMNDIDVLLISDNHINVSINVINDLVNNGVCLILCNQQKLPNSYVLGYKVQKQSYINFKKQLEWDDEFKLKCWQWIIKIKINNQFDLLDHFLSFPEDWENKREILQKAISSQDEAQIASMFFRSLYGSSFTRKKENVINDCLNYGYVILTNMVARSLTKKGLNCNISFFHGSIYSAFPLAYDVVEIFRIIIDLFVKTLFENNIISTKISNFTREIKNCLLDYIANFKINIDGKFEFINNSIDKVVDWIINGDFENHSITFDYQIENKNYETYQQIELEQQI